MVIRTIPWLAGACLRDNPARYIGFVKCMTFELLLTHLLWDGTIGGMIP